MSRVRKKNFPSPKKIPESNKNFFEIRNKRIRSYSSTLKPLKKVLKLETYKALILMKHFVSPKNISKVQKKILQFEKIKFQVATLSQRLPKNPQN